MDEKKILIIENKQTKEVTKIIRDVIAQDSKRVTEEKIYFFCYDHPESESGHTVRNYLELEINLLTQSICPGSFYIGVDEIIDLR